MPGAGSALDFRLVPGRMALYPRILILFVPHGAAHQRAAKALRKAILELRPDAQVEVIDILQHCTAWFRTYYNSFLIILKLWPGLWRRIENIQHQSKSTGPGWIYQQGAQPFFRYVRDFAPDVVISTEVGTCELAALCKRQAKTAFLLAGVELMDFNRAWVQPEVDLLLTTHVDLAAELVAAGAPASRVVTTGQPIDPTFACLPDRESARETLGVKHNALQLLILLGGTGLGDPGRILPEVSKIQHQLEVVIITGRNQRIEAQLRNKFDSVAHVRVLGWVDNIQEWMVASDLMISKPGGGTLTEGFACGLPMLAFDPLPGNEERTCQWIEKWGGGIWIRKPEHLAPTIESLLADRPKLYALRDQARALARPHAARDGALAVLDLLAQKNAKREKEGT
jgi:processive 1,2-diacylglycerol beta-glucosyltransferase